ncbi:MAG: 50S ribosomal protein L29 [Dehalococcoidia bacterium]|nr:50S ribosomal protein L29 [Dehalococcoidia bacterium]MDW8119303.1 50S ribosomal protein L29 [Chloroflexota bacterium]
MRLADIRARSTEDLQKEVQNLYRELANLRWRWHTRQLENYEEIKRVRKTIARVLTVLRERELGISHATQ